MISNGQQNARARMALDKQLQPLRDMAPLVRPDGGWVRTIRQALGMSNRQFARRLGVLERRVRDLEKAEVEDRLLLETLRKAADALDCDLVYALAPRRPLEDVALERALALAARELERTGQTMRSGKPMTDAELRLEREILARNMLRSGRRIWAED